MALQPKRQIPAFPLIETPLVGDDRTITHPWHRFFISLWQKTGGSTAGPTNTVYITQGDDDNAPLVVRKSIPPDFPVLGTFTLQNTGGGPAVPQVLGASPFIFEAPKDGTLVVFAAQVELSRDAGATYYKVTLQGGAIPVLLFDKVRVTWFGPNLPEVTYFPISAD